MLISLAVFLVFAIKVALAAAGYVDVANGYQILVNQGIVNLTAQTRLINIDTSKVTTSFFIPTKTRGEVDSYLASALHAVVQNGVDITPPTIYTDTPHLSATNSPAYELDFYINENGWYGANWHLSGHASTMPTSTIAISANQTVTFIIGNTADTGYDYTIVAKDASENASSYTDYVFTSSDTQAPTISNITDKTPGKANPAGSDITFSSDEAGEFQIVYSSSIDTLPAPASDNWSNMVAGENMGAAGDAGVNTNFYYIIYARDALSNVGDTGVLTIGNPGGSGITITGEDPIPASTDVIFTANINGNYVLAYNTTGDFTETDGARDAGKSPNESDPSMSAGSTGYRVTVGNDPLTHYYYKIYTYNSDTGLRSDTGILELTTIGK